ncbi:MAG: rhomboid family intramembrane serine protease [Lachnospiraceae bacterium]|nr:rhomboid family intramembrane serine protease [Lachnospiraceae bacterium]
MGDIIDLRAHKRKKLLKAFNKSKRTPKKYNKKISKHSSKVYALIVAVAALLLILVSVLKRYTLFSATYSLIGINTIVFILIYFKKLYFYELGLSYDRTIRAGEYYRIVTAAFTHQEVWHILMNMYSLYNLGRALEPFLGTYRFIIFYTIIMILEGYISAQIHRKHKPDVYCIGASGVLCGLMGMYLVLAFLMMGFDGIRGSIPSIICLVLMTASSRIDSIGHFVGLGVGLICGGVVWQII